jgi:putative proteasome-type protease
MTYCVGMLPSAGLVLIADTRTNAGIDNISIYKKLHVLADSDDRLVVLASAGSLSVTQSMLSMLEEGLAPDEEGGPLRTVATAPTMFRAAAMVGEALAAARKAIGHVLAGSSINAGVSLLLGGRIGDGPLKLYLVYDEGNFIECSPESPFLQIGELKFGKPILDRVLALDSPLDEAVKVGLLSFDSTIRSNLSVGPPLDLMVIPVDREAKVIRRRIEEGDPYFSMLSSEWGRLLNEARQQIPDPPFLKA